MQDYYPFGSPMPGRSIANTAAYKQGYQGQQVDGETGFNAFELRLYDSRLGGWLTPDPYRQHLSPYMAMSNNPFSAVDPDGGWDEEHGNGEGFNGDQHSTFAMIDELYDQCPRCTAEEVGMMLDSYNRLGFVNPALLQEIGTSTVYNGSDVTEWTEFLPDGVRSWGGSVDRTHTNNYYITVNNGKLTNFTNGVSDQREEGEPLVKDISNNKIYPGIKIYQTDYMQEGTGVTLPGIGIFIHSSVTGNSKVRMLQHEYGHYLDYLFSPDINFPGQIAIVNFYFKIGVPSILNLTPGINLLPGLNERHHDFYTEKRADKWAEIWFGKNYLK